MTERMVEVVYTYTEISIRLPTLGGAQTPANPPARPSWSDSVVEAPQGLAQVAQVEVG